MSRPKSTTVIKLKAGTRMLITANQPIITARSGFLWIGNDAEYDRWCFATLSGKKTLLKLAAEIKSAAMKLKR